MTAIAPCERPTFYFIGVSTQQSAIMQIFPRWMAHLGIDAVIRGYDIPLRAPAEAYRAIVQHIASDPLAQGGLVTSHKIDLLQACRQEFAALDSYAQLCGEISCIAKREGRLLGYAKDPISSALAWDAIVPAAHWGETGAEVLCLGAGGAGVSISVSAALRAATAERPRRFSLVDQDAQRLEKLRAIHQGMATDIEFRYYQHSSANQNDALLARLPPGSLVINATGMGKDSPGSPLSSAAQFPQHGLVWELNYRGELPFYHHAKAQQQARELHVEDGWLYFLHGWTQAIVEVFDFSLTPDLFAALGQLAST